MKLKNLLKHSGIWTGFVVNPYHWQFVIQNVGTGELAPKVFGKFVSFGPLWIRVIVDDGTVN